MGKTIKCNICGDKIKSMSRHDYKKCECGRIAIDGGDDYMKINYIKYDDFTIIDEDEVEISS